MLKMTDHGSWNQSSSGEDEDFRGIQETKSTGLHERYEARKRGSCQTSAPMEKDE